MLHQDPLVFLPFTVLDNLLLASPGGLRIDRRQARQELAEMCDRFGFALDPNSLARTLTVGERQQLEMVRLLWLGARVLVLDEPTTGISAPQRVKLFETLRTLATEGMSVIFVSHKLEEVDELCQRVTVMRQGKVVGHAEMPCPSEQLVKMMFGSAVEIEAATPMALGDPLLRTQGLTINERLLSVANFDIEVRSGEVIGLAGLEGSGQQTLLRACSGLRSADAGTIELDGVDITQDAYAGRLERGVQFLPAGRLEEGLITGLTLTEHLVLGDPHSGFFVDWAHAETAAAGTITSNHIKGRPSSTADELSGGNQQRLLLAMLRPGLRLLLMEHPTRGLDIESANWVWGQLLARRSDGTAIMFASADLDELLRYSNRILVFFAGRVIAELDVDKTDVEELGFLIGGKVRDSQ
jgi:simple sugar transport system ATP-binding protein